jgi:hypothetical protein
MRIIAAVNVGDSLQQAFNSSQRQAERAKQKVQEKAGSGNAPAPHTPPPGTPPTAPNRPRNGDRKRRRPKLPAEEGRRASPAVLSGASLRSSTPCS